MTTQRRYCQRINSLIFNHLLTPLQHVFSCSLSVGALLFVRKILSLQFLARNLVNRLYFFLSSNTLGTRFLNSVAQFLILIAWLTMFLEEPTFLEKVQGQRSKRPAREYDLGSIYAVGGDNRAEGRVKQRDIVLGREVRRHPMTSHRFSHRLSFFLSFFPFFIISSSHSFPPSRFAGFLKLRIRAPTFASYHCCTTTTTHVGTKASDGYRPND